MNESTDGRQLTDSCNTVKWREDLLDFEQFIPLILYPFANKLYGKTTTNSRIHNWYPRRHHASDKSNSLSLSLSWLLPFYFFIYFYLLDRSKSHERDCFKRDSSTKFPPVICESRFIETKKGRESKEYHSIKSKVSLTEQSTIYEWNKPTWWTARDTINEFTSCIDSCAFCRDRGLRANTKRPAS